MFVIPYGVDNPMRRVPWANWLLIAANVAVFGLQLTAPVTTMTVYDWEMPVDAVTARLALVPGSLRLHQLITSGFLHWGILHLVFNTFGLWVFGNNVNEKLGQWAYLGLYVACLVFGSMAHAIAERGSMVPCAGASGAVMGAMGLYVALFPLHKVRVFCWIWLRVGTFRVSSYWVIGAYVVLDLLKAVGGTAGDVAVVAHVAGFAVGFGGALLLLTAGFVARDPFDIVSWYEGPHRRLSEQFRRTAADPLAAAALEPLALPEGRVPGADELRRAVRQHLEAGRVEPALRLYAQFIGHYPSDVLDIASQCEVANGYSRAGLYAEAAEAYERFARFYYDNKLAGDMLYAAAMLRIEHLDDAAGGKALLRQAIPLLRNPRKISHAREVLGR